MRAQRHPSFRAGDWYAAEGLECRVGLLDRNLKNELRLPSGLDELEVSEGGIDGGHSASPSRRQPVPVRIRVIVGGATPYILASVVAERSSTRIASTSSSVSFALGFKMPMGLETLPFAILSSLLSWFVPKKRWPGLKQGGLSQRCNTWRPAGISPLLIIQDNRCTKHSCANAGVRDVRPYPLGFRQPLHSQHSVLGTITR